MASEITRPAYRGLGIPDLNLNAQGALWDAEINVTVEGGQPGRPVAQGDTDLVLYANGQRQSTTDIHVMATRAGNIDADGANFVWKLAGDTYWRARIPPMSIWGWESTVYTDGTGSGVTSSKHPFVLALPNGTLLQANQQEHATLGHQVVVRRRSASDSSFASTLVYSRPGGYAAGNDNQCCLLAVPRGAGHRVFLFFWWQDVDAEVGNIRAHYSDDNGATWSLASRGVLPDDIEFSSSAYEGQRIRAAYRRGQIVLFVGLKGQQADAEYFIQHIRQYASTGASLSFVQIADSQGQGFYEGRFFDVLSTEDAFVFAYCNQISTSVNRNVVMFTLDDAFMPFTSIPIQDSVIGSSPQADESVFTIRDFDPVEDIAYLSAAAGAVFSQSDGDLAMCRHDDGSIYLYRRSVHDGTLASVEGKNEVHVFRSTDNGRVFRPVGTSDACVVTDPLTEHQCATVWQSQDEQSYPYNLSVTSWQGRVVMAHQWRASPGNEDDSIGLMYLGGYCNIALPRTKLLPDPMSVMPWILNWLPIDEPGDMSSWTAAGLGTDALSVADGALNISTLVNARFYTNTDTTTAIEGYIVRTVVRLNSGSGLSASRTGIRLQAATSLVSYAIQVRLSTTGIRVYDEMASAAVGSDVSVDMTSEVDIVCAMQDGKVQLWYRARAQDDDLAYTLGVSGTLTDGGSGFTDELQWGVFDNDTSNSDWFEFHSTRDEFTGATVEKMPDMVNPDDLVGTPYRREGVYVTDGVRVFATRGPALEGDEHIISHIGQYSPPRLLVTMRPSPRDYWRSKDDNSEHTIALSYEHGSRAGAANTHAMSDAQYAVIDNFNFRTFYIEGYDASTSSWTTVVNGDAATSWLPFGWGIAGSRAKAIGTGIGPYPQLYLEPDELVGWTAEFVGASTTLRRIIANTEGNTDGSKDGRKAVVLFEGADGTESNTTATRFWSSSMLLRWNLLGAKYAAYRIRIPAQDTVDGYFRVGSFHVGDIAVFGVDYSWGRQQSSEHGSQIVEAEDRTHIVTERAPVRRTVSIDWSDGVDTSNVGGDSPDPDYIKLSSSSGAEPVASSRDVPFLLDGLYRRTNGPGTCVVYIPRITAGPPGTEQFKRKGRDFLVGYVDGTVERDSALGDENVDEVFRVGRISITEVV